MFSLLNANCGHDSILNEQFYGSNTILEVGEGQEWWTRKYALHTWGIEYNVNTRHVSKILNRALYRLELALRASPWIWILKTANILNPVGYFYNLGLGISCNIPYCRRGIGLLSLSYVMPFRERSLGRIILDLYPVSPDVLWHSM